MVSSVEPWWAGLCARPFDGAQGDIPLFVIFYIYLWAIMLQKLYLFKRMPYTRFLTSPGYPPHNWWF